MIERRSALILAAGLAAAGAARAQDADPRMAERAIGKPDAPVTVIEYFSLTCGHCAAFHRDTLPRVKRDLVEPGRVRMIWRDFPLDQVGLMAAMVARALPAERYEGFISTLFSTQDRWAFARGADPRRELARLAAVAGMSQEAFDAASTDQELGRAILEMRVNGQQEFNISSTPTFVFGSRVVPGNIAYDRFATIVGETR